MQAVHRLNGSGLDGKSYYSYDFNFGLRYSRSLPKGNLQKDFPLGMRVYRNLDNTLSCESQRAPSLQVGVNEVNLRKDHCQNRAHTANLLMPSHKGSPVNGGLLGLGASVRGWLLLVSVDLAGRVQYQYGSVCLSGRGISGCEGWLLTNN